MKEIQIMKLLMRRKILMIFSLLVGMTARNARVTARKGTLEIPTYVLGEAEKAPIIHAMQDNQLSTINFKRMTYDGIMIYY